MDFRPTKVRMPSLALVETKRITVCGPEIVLPVPHTGHANPDPYPFPKNVKLKYTFPQKISIYCLKC